SVLSGARCGVLDCSEWWPLFTLGDRFGVAAAVGRPSGSLASWRNAAQKEAPLWRVGLCAPPQSLRAPLVLYVAKAWPSGSRSGRGEGCSRRLGRRGWPVPELCAQFRGFSRFFAPGLGLLLWRPAALTGSAFCEFAFCGFEVGAVAIVAVVGDVRSDDV